MRDSFDDHQYDDMEKLKRDIGGIRDVIISLN